MDATLAELKARLADLDATISLGVKNGMPDSYPVNYAVLLRSFDRLAEEVKQAEQRAKAEAETRPDRAIIDTAYDWHEGGYPLYQFASLGGRVVSERHRADLIESIRHNLAWLGRYEIAKPKTYRREYIGEPSRLVRLSNYVASAEVAPLAQGQD